MCGISGAAWTDAARAVSRETLVRMTDCLRHRGPDDEGLYTSDVAAHLGEVLWQVSRRDDAERVWSEAKQAGADNHLLDATRQRLHAAK